MDIIFNALGGLALFLLAMTMMSDNHTARRVRSYNLASLRSKACRNSGNCFNSKVLKCCVLLTFNAPVRFSAAFHSHLPVWIPQRKTCPHTCFVLEAISSAPLFFTFRRQSNNSGGVIWLIGCVLILGQGVLFNTVPYSLGMTFAPNVFLIIKPFQILQKVLLKKI